MRWAAPARRRQSLIRSGGGKIAASSARSASQRPGSARSAQARAADSRFLSCCGFTLAARSPQYPGSSGAHAAVKVGRSIASTSW